MLESNTPRTRSNDYTLKTNLPNMSSDKILELQEEFEKQQLEVAEFERDYDLSKQEIDLKIDMFQEDRLFV